MKPTDRDYINFDPAYVPLDQFERAAMEHWGLVIDQVVVLSAVYGIDVDPRTPQEVHDAWQRLVPIIAARAEESLRLSGLELMETTAEMLRSISRNMTSQPFDGSIEIDRLANELDPPSPGTHTKSPGGPLFVNEQLGDSTTHTYSPSSEAAHPTGWAAIVRDAIDRPPAGDDHPGTDAWLIDRAEHDDHTDTPDRED